MTRSPFPPIAVLAAGLLVATAALASSGKHCRDPARPLFINVISLCFESSERINCPDVCNHLRARVKDMPGGMKATEECREQKHDPWQVCYQDQQIPCENIRDHMLNDCIVSAQALFHDRWIECPIE